MQKLLISALAAVLLTGVSLAQSKTMQLASGSIIRVELAKTIDAKKAKVGDELVAKTMDDFRSNKNEVLAPAGSKVLGHVVEVSPHKDHSASTLGISFDKVVMKDGAEIPLKASIQAIGWPPSNSEGVPVSNATSGVVPVPATRVGGNGAGMPVPGGMAPGNANTPAPMPEEIPNAGVNRQLAPNAQGVVGMSGVSLSTGAAQDSLLTSPKHNVKLDSGTQIILRVI